MKNFDSKKQSIAITLTISDFYHVLRKAGENLSAHQFPCRFLNPRVFSAYYIIHCSQNLVDFVLYPYQCFFCAFGAKWHGTGKVEDSTKGMA